MDTNKQQGPPPSYGFQPPPAYDQQYIPQQANFDQQSQVQPQVVTVITRSAFGPDPTPLQCPSCRTPIVTRVDYETTTKTHLFAAIICLLCWPCAWIPYTTDSCKGANHYCPNCGCYLGRHDN